MMAHDCDHLTAVLLGESPWPGDAHVHAGLAECPDCRELHEALGTIDEQARALPALPAPEPVRNAVLQAVLDEMQRNTTGEAPLALQPPARRPWRPAPWTWAATGLAAAAALLLVVPLPDAPPGPSTLVERGSGVRLPEASLKMAVRTGAGVARFRAGHPYAPGDVLLFRADIDSPAQVHLLRIDGQGAAELGAWELAAGEHDLSLDGQSLAWRIEPAETTAVYALLAAPVDHPGLDLPDARARAYDPEQPGVCIDARKAGWVCEAHTVEVAP